MSAITPRAWRIEELPTLDELHAWADERGVQLRYLGPTLESHPVYGALCISGGTAEVRVVVLEGRDPHHPPLVWRSPLENLPLAELPR